MTEFAITALDNAARASELTRGFCPRGAKVQA
jgi:hypothetical protein